MSFLERDKNYSIKRCGKKSRKQLEDKAVRQTKPRINRNLNTLIWAINLIIKRINRIFIALNTMVENANNSFTNNSIPFLTLCSQHQNIFY